MDIDDILASVDRDANIQTPESATLDHQLLTRFWVAERAVSELLPWPASLMDRMMERVRKHVSTPRSLQFKMRCAALFLIKKVLMK